MKTRILAILQNQWFKDPQRAQASIDRLVKLHGPHMRRRFIARALFAGSKSGRRIRTAFGGELALLERLEWEECSKEISGHSGHVPTPDPEHIKETIAAVDPHIIITFGVLARDATMPLFAGPIITAPHPAARGVEVPRQLLAAVERLAEQTQLYDDMADQLEATK